MQVNNMGRKRSNTTPADPTAAPGTGTNGAAAEGTDRKEGATPATKQEAVRLALAAGIRSPTEIAGYVKRTFGMEMTPAHVSTVKGFLKRKKKAKKQKTRGGKKRAEAQADRAVPAPSKTKPAAQTQASGLTPGDLSALVEMAQRAGGIERLVEYLEVLKGIR
jgi:hypothetical protein